MVDFMEIIFLGIGLLIGTITAWFIAKYKFTNRNGSLNRNEINEKYVLKEIHSSIQNQADLLRDNLEEKEQELRKIGSQLSAKENEIVNINERLVSQKSEVENLQQRFQTEFENIANRLLEEKSQKFSQQNQSQLNHILNPLKQKIQEFETGVNTRFVEETRDRISLKKEIEQLRDLNMQLSVDANNLVTALKGESKTQGD